MATEAEILQALARAPLLGGLAPMELSDFAAQCRIADFAPGEDLLLQGRLNDRLLLIMSGDIELVRRRANVEERVSRIGPGACLGEMSALTGRPVALTARAITRVRAATLDKEAALRALETRPRLGSNLAMILIDHLQGHLGRREARTSLLVLDDTAGDGEIEAVRALVSGVARYSRRTVVADLTDQLRLARARGLPSLADLDNDPRHSATIERELYNSLGVFWTLRLGAPTLEPHRVLRALRLLDQYCDQLMVLVQAKDAEALLAGTAKYFNRTVWITRQGARPPPIAVLPVADDDGRKEPLRILLNEDGRPATNGAMRVLDARCGGKAFVAGGNAPDARGTLALARDLAGQRIGLALGSGATRGFAHIGVLEKLTELGLPIDAIVGSSAGSGIGSVWSFGFEPDRIAKSFGELQKHAAKWTIPTRSLLSGKAIARHIVHTAGGCGFDDARWPFGVVAVDLYAAREQLFTSGDLAQCILASCAIPGIYPPIRLGDRWYVDGGVLNPVPSAFARPLGADVVIAIDLAAATPEDAGPPQGRHPSLLNVLRHSAELMHARITQHSGEAADLIIRPRCEGPPPGLTDYAKAGVWRDFGRDAVALALPELRALLPWFGASH